jgi:hypothetical protein
MKPSQPQRQICTIGVIFRALSNGNLKNNEKMCAIESKIYKTAQVTKSHKAIQ